MDEFNQKLAMAILGQLLGDMSPRSQAQTADIQQSTKSREQQYAQREQLHPGDMQGQELQNQNEAAKLLEMLNPMLNQQQVPPDLDPDLAALMQPKPVPTQPQAEAVGLGPALAQLFAQTQTTQPQSTNSLAQRLPPSVLLQAMQQ